MSDKMDSTIIVLLDMSIILIALFVGAYFIHHYTVSEGRLKVALCMANDTADTEYDCRKRHGYWGDLK
jgi:hypothetical protein